jgi:hypothetical protein
MIAARMPATLVRTDTATSVSIGRSAAAGARRHLMTDPRALYSEWWHG